jgi:hypothetical protein
MAKIDNVTLKEVAPADVGIGRLSEITSTEIALHF